MGFLHCPICVVLAFISVFIGVSRSFLLLILFRELLTKESEFKLNLSLT